MKALPAMTGALRRISQRSPASSSRALDTNPLTREQTVCGASTEHTTVVDRVRHAESSTTSSSVKNPAAVQNAQTKEPKIAMLGMFGSGNTGNDGSLEAMVSFLREARPDAELLCICPNPETVTSRYGVAAVRQGRVDITGHRAARMSRMLGDLPRNMLSIIHLFATLRGVRVLVIPGTGILDDFQETAFGWPFVVFRWCLAARLRGVQVAFVSIGAGPIKNSLSRWFLKSAVRLAKYRSYRDDYSYQYLKDNGVDVSLDRRFPDLAFGLPLPSQLSPIANKRKVVGVGVMDYHGWSKDNAEGDSIYLSYLGKLSSYICWLIEQGHDVRLLTGDVHDMTAVDDVLKMVVEQWPDVERQRITVGCGGSLHELMAEIAQTDAVVVSRYHNVVCALKLDRPTISLSYNMKNDYLLAQFGQHYCQHIESFDFEVLKQHTNAVLGNSDEITAQLARTNALVQVQLEEQQHLLLNQFAKMYPVVAKQPGRDIPSHQQSFNGTPYDDEGDLHVYSQEGTCKETPSLAAVGTRKAQT
ncbi:polysaccharide pyruvyl transferase family protein [Phyllobacterium endophyticum]|uniref:Exopolysaccharide biosynthesis protein n=1 Tax=Phyllobacterium endophyticum TaxID=1149773 RepID=A0A2P7AUT1_9HYPH|nr:polysaccharide pyruvyl transferase family protein [Phyllobacterium endophyticum]MBB3234480.1 polysaccharide pyruvyl transferase WcaK-like protein [Phyllobacterium endophyticum]PSH57979.1 exopolysaccharide biosynthesis protein [Phyllobacterium endophyticum]TYR39501.1 exopolysaccharide biosynthesis protein [Phyllobacterium endophyticum]